MDTGVTLAVTEARPSVKFVEHFTLECVYIVLSFYEITLKLGGDKHICGLNLEQWFVLLYFRLHEIHRQTIDFQQHPVTIT